MIEPVVLKGFRDSLPKEEIPKRMIMSILEGVFTSYGFSPIDTPVLEYSSILLGKGGGETDKQVFSFLDNGGREVSMRFDLTVPFARFLASHLSEVALPFKRYHINKVWRGEKPQKGRYREFIQCDFDIVGDDSALSDSEILSVMNTSFTSLIKSGFTFHISHRGLLNYFLSSLDLTDKAEDILRLIDKKRKIKEEELIAELNEITQSLDKTNKILLFISPDENKTFLETLSSLEELSGGESEGSKRLRDVYAILEETGIDKHFVLDPSITRGLDYYTGLVYETFLDDLPSIGSVCSGGRYNNLASLYTKEVLPGVGSSIGLDRLMAALVELKSPLLENLSSADILIENIDESDGKTLNVATLLRSNGLKCDIFYEKNAKAKKLYDYAEKNSIPYLLFIQKDGLKLKDLKTRETVSNITLEEVVERIKA